MDKLNFESKLEFLPIVCEHGFRFLWYFIMVSFMFFSFINNVNSSSIDDLINSYNLSSRDNISQNYSNMYNMYNIEINNVSINDLNNNSLYDELDFDIILNFNDTLNLSIDDFVFNIVLVNDDKNIISNKIYSNLSKFLISFNNSNGVYLYDFHFKYNLSDFYFSDIKNELNIGYINLLDNSSNILSSINNYKILKRANYLYLEKPDLADLKFNLIGYNKSSDFLIINISNYGDLDVFNFNFSIYNSSNLIYEKKVNYLFSNNSVNLFVYNFSKYFNYFNSSNQSTIFFMRLGLDNIKFDSNLNNNFVAYNMSFSNGNVVLNDYNYFDSIVYNLFGFEYFKLSDFSNYNLVVDHFNGERDVNNIINDSGDVVINRDYTNVGDNTGSDSGSSSGSSSSYGRDSSKVGLDINGVSNVDVIGVKGNLSLDKENQSFSMENNGGNISNNTIGSVGNDKIILDKSNVSISGIENRRAGNKNGSDVDRIIGNNTVDDDSNSIKKYTVGVVSAISFVFVSIFGFLFLA